MMMITVYPKNIMPVTFGADYRVPWAFIDINATYFPLTINVRL